VELERLAYEAAIRSLDRQEELLNELRARSGILVGASSLAAPFLGRPALEDANLPLLIAALAAFACAVGASLYVLLPRRDLSFSMEGAGIYEELYPWRHDPAEIYRRLAYHLDWRWDSNNVRLDRVVRAFRVATWSLAAEVVLLLASVGVTLL
jgi:hypothetical protein